MWLVAKMKKDGDLGAFYEAHRPNLKDLAHAVRNYRFVKLESDAAYIRWRGIERLGRKK